MCPRIFRLSGLKRLPVCHGCLDRLPITLSYAEIMEINVQEETTCKRQNKQLPLQQIYFPNLLYKTLQTPKVNFENLVG